MGCTASVVPNEPNQPNLFTKQIVEINTAIPVTPLECEQVDIVQTLSSGLEFTDVIQDGGGKNLFLAIKRGDLAAVGAILQTHNSDLTLSPVNKMVGMWQSSPLVVAVQYGFNDIAKLLLLQENLGDLSIRNDKGADALLFACMEGMTDIVEKLLKLGLRPSSVPTCQPVYNLLTDQNLICTSLSIVIYNGRQNVLILLMEASGDEIGDVAFQFPVLKSISSKSSINVGVTGVTPFSLACATGRLGIVKELLWRKCISTLYSVDSDQSTVLHHLCRARHDAVDIFRELQRHNLVTEALLFANDASGDTALHVAVDHKQEDLVHLLLDEGSSGSAKNALTGWTPLHTAIKRKSAELVRVLLEHGADPLAPNVDGKSPLDMVEKLRKDSDIYQLVSNAAKGWQELRGMTAQATTKSVMKTVEQQQQSVSVGVSVSCVVSPSTVPETVPHIEAEKETHTPFSGEDDVIDFSPLEDSFVSDTAVAHTALSFQLDSSSCCASADAERESSIVSEFAQDLFESVKESQLLSGTTTSTSPPLRPVPPPAKEGGASFKRGTSRVSAVKYPDTTANKTPTKQQQQQRSTILVEMSSSAYSTPVKSSTEMSSLTPSAVLPILLPSSPISVKQSGPSSSSRTNRATVASVYGSVKMPTPSSFAKDKRGSAVSRK